MAQFRKRAVPVEAITFDELVAHGLASGAAVTPGPLGGLPESFTYLERQITLRNGSSYWIPTLKGRVAFEKGDMLVSDRMGALMVYSAGDFIKVYAPVEPQKEEGAPS